MAAFEKSCRLIRLIWSPLLPFIYSIISMRSIIVTFRHLDTILLPFVYWKRYLWSMSAPPTNLVNWSKWSEPLFERSLTLSVSDLSVKLLWTLTSPHVVAYVRRWLLLSLCLVCNWTHVRLATDTIAFDNYCQWIMLDLSVLVRKHHHVCSSIISATQVCPCCLL